MKRIFLGSALVASAMISQVAAVDILKNNDSYVSIYGTLRGYFGYGNVMTSSPFAVNDDGLMFGIQGNSRIGIKAGVGGFDANVEIGANETTVYGNSADAGIGLRQAWASWTTDGGHVFLAGKTDTFTSMNGYSSDIFFNDGGGAGFGGLGTSNRRFQMQYKYGNFGVALIENEAMSSQLHTGVRWAVPRIAVGYNVNEADYMMNLAATYAYAGDYTSNSSVVGDVNILSLVFGIKPKIGETGWLSFMLSYGMNDDLTGEQKIGVPSLLTATGGASSANVTKLTAKAGTSGDVDNLHRVSALLELGGNVTSNLAVVVGGGYQYARLANSTDKNMDTYTLYVQAPYKVSSFFSIIPQVGWYGLNTNNDAGTGNGDKIRISSILAAAQARFTF